MRVDRRWRGGSGGFALGLLLVVCALAVGLHAMAYPTAGASPSPEATASPDPSPVPSASATASPSPSATPGSPCETPFASIDPPDVLPGSMVLVVVSGFPPNAAVTITLVLPDAS